MLANACRNAGSRLCLFRSTHCSNTRLRATSRISNSVWITDTAFERAFASFSRRLTKPLPPCINNLNLGPRIFHTQVSDVKVKDLENFEIKAVDSGLFDGAPPSFICSPELTPINLEADGKALEPDSCNYMAMQTSKPLVDDPWSSLFVAQKPADKEPPRSPRNKMSFFQSILQPITVTPQPAPETSHATSRKLVLPNIPSPYARELLADLQGGLFTGKMSVNSMALIYEEIIQQTPPLYLSSKGVTLFLRALLRMQKYWHVVQVLEREDVITADVEKIFKKCMEMFEREIREKIMDELIQFCSRAGRTKLVRLLVIAGKAICKDLGEESGMETKPPVNSTIVVRGRKLKQLKKEEDLALIEQIMKCSTIPELDRVVKHILAMDDTISIATSRAIFQCYVDLNGIEEAIDYLFLPSVNIPGSNNIATLCGSCCERGQHELGFKIIQRSLENNDFDPVSNVDLQEGLRCANTEEQLISLWKLVKGSRPLQLRDISAVTLGIFIGRACQGGMKLGKQWRKMNGETPLLVMCVDIIVRAPESAKILLAPKIATLIETWIWQWAVNNDDDKQRTDTTTLEHGIPYMSPFLQTLPLTVADSVLLTTMRRVIRNCLRSKREVWPLKFLWPFVSTVAQTSLWKNEESLGIYYLERTLLNKGLATSYLSFRTDAAIARFVVRHYLPFRVANCVHPIHPNRKVDAQNILVKLRDLERLYVMTDFNVFAAAILAFQGTSIPMGTLIPDMAFTLYRLGRVDDLISMLRILSRNEIAIPTSFCAALIRKLTPEYPHQTLELFKQYPMVQESAYKYYIGSTAREYPALAMKAYRILSRPHLFNNLTQARNRAKPRKPKEGLLVTLASDFACSQQLSTAQATRAVRYLLIAMMLPPPYRRNGKLVRALTTVGVERRESDGVDPDGLKIPLAKRLRWILKQVQGQGGKKKREEVAAKVMRAGVRVRRRRRILGR